MQRLKAKVGELTMENELLYERVGGLGAVRPFTGREIGAMMSQRVSSSAARRYGLARVSGVGHRTLDRLLDT